MTAAQLDNTVAGVLMLRDQPGTSAVTEGAHGNAFDRIRALQEGVEQGAERCAGYRADNLPVTEVPFQDVEDAASRRRAAVLRRRGQPARRGRAGLLAAHLPAARRRQAWAQLPVEPFDSA